jgi:hypothetical protein
VDATNELHRLRIMTVYTGLLNGVRYQLSLGPGDAGLTELAHRPKVVSGESGYAG